MERVITIKNKLGMGTDKYVFKKEYEGWRIYDYMTPSGFKVHQHFLITDGTKKYICEPYNGKCEEELLDAIDKYNKTGKLGFRVFEIDTSTYAIHPAGAKLV